MWLNPHWEWLTLCCRYLSDRKEQWLQGAREVAARWSVPYLRLEETVTPGALVDSPIPFH